MYLFEGSDIPIKTDAEKYSEDFQTPAHVAEYMVSLLPENVQQVLEPTPGKGNIVNALKGKNFEVTAPKDFFKLKPKKYDAVVMNPPFSAKYAILENAPFDLNKSVMRVGYYILTECMKLADVVITLIPWFTISDSDVRLRYLKDFGLKSLTALPRKTFEYTRIQTVIIQLEKGWNNTTLFHVYDKSDNTQPET